MHLNPPLSRVWARRGKPARVPAAGRDEKAVIFGAWNFRTEQFLWNIAEGKNSDAFMDFLRHIEDNKVSDRQAKLVMDNAPYHRSNKVEGFLADREGELEPFWLPPYSPELNLIERVWRYLKEKVTNNYFFGTFSRLQKAVIRACRDLSSPGSKILDITFKPLEDVCPAA